jgi:addiction module RelE/StbE family toxin
MLYQIDFTRSFEKQYVKLPAGDKAKFQTRLKLFEANPYHPLLNNHGLKGRYLGYRSINVRGDLRALYTMQGRRIVVFSFIGTHSQLYR